MAEHNVFGDIGEEAATRYLIRKGYTILERNWRSISGYELDIIARRDAQLVVVEVKTRRDEHYATALEAVDYTKREHIRRATLSYLNFRNLRLPVRYDIITVIGDVDHLHVAHYEGAFE